MAGTSIANVSDVQILQVQCLNFLYLKNMRSFGMTDCNSVFNYVCSCMLCLL